MSDLTKNYLGKEMTADEIVKQLAAMLGWGNTPPWHVLERDLVVKLNRLKEVEIAIRGSHAVLSCALLHTPK